MNRPWFEFYSLQLGMSRLEIFDLPYGRTMDLIACLSIFNGGAEQKVKKKLTYDEAMGLR